MVKKNEIIPNESGLFDEINTLIEQSRSELVSQVNSTLTLHFWQIGSRINAFVLEHKRAEYGKQIVVTLSRQLVAKHGRSFEEKNLRRMLQFAEVFPEYENVVTLSRYLSWSHFLTLLPLKTEEQRLFYARKVSQEQISVRNLRKQIQQKTFERTAIADSQIPETTHHLSGNFKDPYLLDFLNLPVGYLEFDMETSILRELEKFILEIGKGFAFVERQKRMIIDGEDFYLVISFTTLFLFLCSRNGA